MAKGLMSPKGGSSSSSGSSGGSSGGGSDMIRRSGDDSTPDSPNNNTSNKDPFEVGGGLSQDEVDELNRIANQDFVDRSNLGSNRSSEPRESGAVSSSNARNAVDNATKKAENLGATNNNQNEDGTGGGVDFSDLRQQIQDLQNQLGSQSTQSGSQNQGAGQQNNTSSEDNTVDVPGTDSQVDTGDDVAADDFGEDVKESEAAMSIIKQRNDQINFNQQLLNSLSAFNDQNNDLISREIGMIEQNLEVQKARVKKENERLSQAARVTGIVSGRARYSPEENQGIISEVIQDGIDRLNSLEIEASKQKIKIRKSQQEMNYKTFIKGTEVLQKINELKHQTFVDVREQLDKEAKQAREQLKFDQEQADRKANILGPEVAGMSDEKIKEVAEANGIEFGKLLSAAKSAEKTNLGLEAKRLSMEETRLGMQETLLGMQNTRSIMRKRNQEIEDMTSDDGSTIDDDAVIDDADEFSRTWGWRPPEGMNKKAAIAISSNFPMLDADDKLELARKWQSGGGKNVNERANELMQDSDWSEALRVIDESEEISDRFKQAEERINRNQSPGWELIQNTFSNQGKKVVGTEAFNIATLMVQEEIQEAKENGENLELTPEEFMDRVADKMLESNGTIHRMYNPQGVDATQEEIESREETISNPK